MTWRTTRIQKKDEYGETAPQGLQKLLPIESLLQYRFAISKPLKARPGPEDCKTAPLCNRSSLFVVVFFRF